MTRTAGSRWIAAACVVALAAPVGATAKEGSRYRDGARSAAGVVAAESRTAAEAGLAVLDAGGNAMDAAVTTVFAVGVTRPEMCGIGGGGFLVYRRADGRTGALDFREKAPGTYTFGSGVAIGPLAAFGTGHNVAGVPGTVAGMAAALRRFGTISLSRAVAPAERLAREGFTVEPELTVALKGQMPRLLLYPHTMRTFYKAGLVPYEPGETLRLPEYAGSLRRIMDGGPRAFYEGPIADAIAADMAQSGLYPGDRGTMTKADLAAYRAVWRKPLRGRYRRHGIVAMPPPTSGGLLAVEILNLLEGFDLRAAGAGSADHLHLLAEAQKIAWADRNAYVGDPDFVDVPVARLASKAYAERRRAEIDPQRAGTPAPGAGERGQHTTHVSVIDRAGNAASITCTIEQPMGSGVVPPGAGFLLNNQLTDFDGPGTANEPQPGKRPRSSTSPTIVTRGGAPVLVIGGAGGSTIPMGVIGSIVRLIDFHEDVPHAVDAERIDARGSCGITGPLQLCLEQARIAPDVLAELRRRGHELIEHGEYAPNPIVQAAGVTRGGGRVAVSDPRGPSGAVGQD